jgi:hypothetical protein
MVRRFLPSRRLAPEQNSVLVLVLLNRRDGPASAGATAMAGAKHFRDLVCWQLANELKLESTGLPNLLRSRAISHFETN